MTLVSRMLLVSLVSLAACAAEDGSSPSDERADTTQVIKFHRPDAPTIIELSAADDAATSSHSISFGHCDEAQTGEDGVINIDCNEKWSELSWLSLSKEDAQSLVDQGQRTLSFDISVTDSTADRDSVRFSIHAVAEDGSSMKLLSKGNVFDGESMAIDLEATEYHVFMARGENSSLIWHNGSIEVDLSASTQ